MVRRRGLPLEPELVPFQASVPPGRRWLCLAPHPDDETFGPGATLAQAADRGVQVVIAVVTDGRAQGDPVLRADEVRRAAAVLGVSALELWGFCDRTLEPGDRRLQRRLDEALTTHAPDLVLVPAPVDLNVDHRALALALQRVLRRRTLWGLRESTPSFVAAYEVASPLLPNLLVAADTGWARKVQAAAIYAGQSAFFPYHEVMEALGTLRRLTLAGCSRAEALHLLPTRRVARLTAGAWAAAMGTPRMVHEGEPPSP